MTPTTKQNEREHPRVLLIFLDGIGVGTVNRARNPFVDAQLPFLRDVFNGHWPTLHARNFDGTAGTFLSASATLGVPGLPQSGTGQSTLYTGLNTAKIIKQHFGPYLYSTLKPVVAEHNIFAQIKELHLNGESVAFANAFPKKFFEYLNGARRRMVAGMFAALSADVPFRDIRSLKEGTAVSADITAARWGELGHDDAPLITPFEAGVNLAGIARKHHFTLFEYFLTDKAGHDRNMPASRKILDEIDCFLRGVYEASDLASTLIIVTSDHGNMEDLATKTHTRNPVPVLLFGLQHRAVAKNIRSISDVTPAIRTLLRD